MALFKRAMLYNYGIAKYKDNVLKLIYGIDESVRAPFDAQVVDVDSYWKALELKNFKLYIGNAKFICGKSVKAGDIIAHPTLIDNNYIEIYLEKDGQKEDVLRYLRLQDNTIIEEPKKPERVKVVKDESEQKDAIVDVPTSEAKASKAQKKKQADKED